MIWWKHNKISTRRFISTLRILDRNSVFERDQTLLIFPKFDWEGRGNSCSDLLYFDTALDLDGWFEFKLYVLNCMKISFIIIMTIIMIMVMIIIIIIIIMIIIIIIFIFIIQFYFIFIYHMYTTHCNSGIFFSYHNITHQNIPHFQPILSYYDYSKNDTNSKIMKKNSLKF